jgi:hypothetical protein
VFSTRLHNLLTFPKRPLEVSAFRYLSHETLFRFQFSKPLPTWCPLRPEQYQFHVLPAVYICCVKNDENDPDVHSQLKRVLQNSFHCDPRCQCLGAFAKLRKATITFFVSVRPSARPFAWHKSVPTGRIFMKFGICGFLENLSRRVELHWNRTRITGTLRGDVCTFMIISRWIIVKMKNV